MAKANKTRYALLGFLSMLDASGYDIKKMMEQSTNNFWRETDSSIYPIFKQLLNEKKVTCAVKNKDSDKPKKVYSITEEGMDEFLQWLEADPVFEQSRNELMLKVFFGWNLDKKMTIGHIKKYQHHLLALEQKYKSFEKNGPMTDDQSSVQVYQYLTLKAGISVVKARLEWCEEAMELLERRQLRAVRLKLRSRKK